MGLSSLASDPSQAAGRQVNFMIYDSVDSATSRPASIIAPDIESWYSVEEDDSIFKP